MILNSPYISGSLTVTSNGTVSGSLTVLGGITGAITGSATSASYAISASEASTLQGLGSASFAPASTFNTVSQSYAASSASLSTRVTTNETNISTLTSASASFAVVSSSYATASGSLSTRVTNVETTASVLTSASSSFATMSGSLSTRVTNLESTSSTVSQSFASTSGSISGRVTLIEGQYATTGSNVFTGPQYVSQASNAISFTSTASLYTDGGLRVSKDSFVSGTAYFNNVVVYGTSSIQYITSSQVNFGTNIITVNTDTPAVRFGGLSVFDSGSTGLTGSMLWDSEANHWVYSNPSGSTYSGGMIISGPRAASLGTEVGTTSCALMMGQGGDHITSSAIFSYSNATCFYGQSSINSSGAACFASTVSATKGTFVGTGYVLDLNRTDNTALAQLQYNGVVGSLLGTTGANNLTIYNASAASMLDLTSGIGCFSGQICAQGATFTTTGNTAVTIASGATGLSRLVFQGTVANSRGFIDYDNSTCGFIIRTNESTALTISNVGAAVFSNALQVAGQQAAANYGGTGLNFDFTSGNVGRIASVKTTSGGSSLELHTYNTSGGDITALTISSTGAATFSNSVTANATSTFSNASSLSAIFSNGGSPSNYNSIELRGGTAGTAVNWQISKDNSTSNAFELAPSTTAGGTTYGSPVFKILNTGAATFSSTVTAGDQIRITGTTAQALYLYGAAGIKPYITINEFGVRDWEIGAGTTASGKLSITSTLGGTDGIIIDGSGNVGLGTSNPQLLLDIQTGNLGVYKNTGSSVDGAQLYLGDMNFAGGAYATSAPGIGSVASPQTSVGGDLAFYVYASAIASRSEAMRIIRTSTGNNVGIGITNPGAKLQVKTTTSAGATDAFYIENTSSALFEVRDDGLTYMKGPVGIGTNNPSAPLHVVGNEYIGKLGGGGQYKQTLVGQVTAATSGSSKKIAYVGHTHSVRVYVWANQSTGNGSSAIADITTMYGSSNGGVTTQANLGNVSNISISYDNGGSPSYTINVTLTYSGAAPTINYIIEGINNDNFIYAL